MNWLVYEKFVKWVNDEFECDNKYNDCMMCDEQNEN